MRLASLVLALPFVMGLGCGSDGGGADDGADDDGDDIVLVPDASPPDAPSIDANSCPGPGNTDICNDECVDFDTDEGACGKCGNPCNGGEACNGGECACPGAIVPTAPAFAQSQVQNVQGFLEIGIGGYEDPNHAGITNALLVTKAPGDAMVGDEVDVSTSLFSPPVFGAIYNGNLTSQEYDALYLAVEGKLVIDQVCADTETFVGHATNVTFQGAHGDLMSGSVTVDPDGCTFTVDRVDFTFGPGCPTE